MRRRNLPSESRKSAEVTSCETFFTKILTEPYHNPETINPSKLRYAMRTCLGTARSRNSDGSVCTLRRYRSLSAAPSIPHSDQLLNNYLYLVSHTPLRRGNHVHLLKEARAMVMPRGYSKSVTVRMVPLMSELPGVGFYYGLTRQNFPAKVPIFREPRLMRFWAV